MCRTSSSSSRDRNKYGNMTFQLMSQPLPYIVNLAVTFRRSQVCCFQKESCDILDLVLSCRNLSGEGKDIMTLTLEETVLVSTKVLNKTKNKPTLHTLPNPTK